MTPTWSVKLFFLSLLTVITFGSEMTMVSLAMSFLNLALHTSSSSFRGRPKFKYVAVRSKIE